MTPLSFDYLLIFAMSLSSMILSCIIGWVLACEYHDIPYIDKPHAKNKKTRRKKQ